MSSIPTDLWKTLTNGFYTGLGGVGGSIAAQKALEAAKKVDKYNVENNPIPRDWDGMIPTDADGHTNVQFSRIENALLWGGAVTSTVSPPVGGAMMLGGSALYGSRLAQNQEAVQNEQEPDVIEQEPDLAARNEQEPDSQVSETSCLIS